MIFRFKRSWSTVAKAVAFLGLAALAQAQNCSNASWVGTHFFLVSGTGPNSTGTLTVPYVQLGKLVADGKGKTSGTATEDANGFVVQLSLTGTYSVNADCSGTQTLTITPAGAKSRVSTSTFQLIEGGRQKITATVDPGYVITGQAYRAWAEEPSVCSDGSLIGSYGFLGAGPAIGTGSPTSIAGGIAFDGKGGYAYKLTLGDASATSGQSGQGTYTVTSDCSGTAKASGGTDDVFAIVEGGNVLHMSAAAGTLSYGIMQPESLSSVLPQVAFGGGWYTALYFSNTTSSEVSFTVTFTADNGSPLDVPALGGSSTEVKVQALGTAIVELPNSGSLVEGYAAFTMAPGVTGYGVFRQTVGGQSQEAVVPFATANANSSTIIWDDTSYTTAVAIVNAGSTAATISINLTDSNGNAVGTSTLNLAAHHKTEAVLRTLPGLSGMAGLRGKAIFSATSGNVAVLGLRANGSAFTSIPATQ